MTLKRLVGSERRREWRQRRKARQRSLRFERRIAALDWRGVRFEWLAAGSIVSYDINSRYPYCVSKS